MPVKRELNIEYYNSDQEDDIKPDLSDSHTPKKSRSKPNTNRSPKKDKSKTNPSDVGSDGLSAKARFAVMIVERGIEALKKDEVEAATGLTAVQQRDLVRKDGKGVLRKALMAIAEKM
ncbi:hypothetical protein I302_103799 [Kwoniella bestiolae CBS 10118]|uniref:Uncharacterized protein n=1 Tax=Kwoniella bestiolae CBS 10118 TaxID=1296100 RepID=A0A1B9G9E3_9TREE|nr:hypothetical protein I302_02502 [Kwoniella bestiolae CBS 10118]OCF27658.1 hypothetical protein I302_02502 [Kwoniella bestiolae CBS 10118]